MNHFVKVLMVIFIVMVFVGGSVQWVVAAEVTDYPKKGRILTIIVPYPAGGSADTQARIIAPLLERRLGIPVVVSDKPGAATQVGMTELTSSKPDGYTILLGSFPGTLIPALDPTRQAAYTRKDFKGLALFSFDPFLFMLLKNSPYKTMKDVVDYAKANPEKFKVAVTGILLPPHLSVLEIENQTGAKFAPVFFDGAAPARTAFFGGHTDGLVCTLVESAVATKGDLARIIGIMDEQENPQAPGVKTMIAQGYNVFMINNEGFVAPSGTPPQIMKILEDALKEAAADEQYAGKIKQLGASVKFRGAKESEEYLNKLGNQIKPLVEAARKKQD
jgi:tripartite-type tricarboxylate transporter receptor subunit TctC